MFKGGRTGHDKDRGLYNKYHVERADGREDKHMGCVYFVLDLTHDKFAAPALVTYAAVCDAEFPVLATELRDLVARTLPTKTVE